MSNFDKLVEQARQHADYWVSGIAVVFAVNVNLLMQEKGIGRSELADRTGLSSQYITKMLRGDANLTLDAMVKIAMVVDAKVDIRLARND